MIRRLLAWVRGREVHHLAALAFTVVAAVAAAISYDHVHSLAGPVWWAWLLPLSIDGLLVAGSLALWIERSAGGRGSPLAWASVVLGLIWSLGANLASTNPDWIPRWLVDPLIAIWPPIALGLAFELLIRVRQTRAPDQQLEGGPDQTADEPDRSDGGGPDQLSTGLSAEGEVALIEKLAEAHAGSGQSLPSRNYLMTRHRIGTGRADRILSAVHDRSAWIRRRSTADRS